DDSEGLLLLYVFFFLSPGSKKDLETRLLAIDDNLRTTTMAPILRSTPLVALLLFQISLLLFASTLPISSGSEDSYTITGRVRIPASILDSVLLTIYYAFCHCRLYTPSRFHHVISLATLFREINREVILAGTAIGHAAKFSNIKVVLNGGQNISFLRPDGYFTFHKVPAGTHLIEVYALGFFFSPVRVDVSARHHGKVQATLTETRRSLTELVLEPLRADQYYELREPFNVMAILKSPMGLMVGFMVVVVFLMPKLMENIDPEEMKRTQEELRNQGVPSLSSLLPASR
ncbi:hypothetical protein F2Q68_00029058, partial [Brassica cretica]